MKIKIMSEDHPAGLIVDWPALPEKDAIVSFDHRGGTNHLQVTMVRFVLDTNGNFDHAEVNLSYPA